MRWVLPLVISCPLLVVSGAIALERTGSRQEDVPVTGSVAVADSSGEADVADVAVWLTPIGDEGQRKAAAARQNVRLRMVQKDKRFVPHALVVQVGSVVDFPNADPFFHNVFSLYDGKRFDLGLYEAGASRSVTFTRLGICFVFCNIHPEMSAVVVVVSTPYASTSASTGEFSIRAVPSGRYMLSVWHERYAPAAANAFPREITISDESRSIGVIQLANPGKPIAPHKNKYGREYNRPAPSSPVYEK